MVSPRCGCCKKDFTDPLRSPQQRISRRPFPRCPFGSISTSPRPEVSAIRRRKDNCFRDVLSESSPGRTSISPDACHALPVNGIREREGAGGRRTRPARGQRVVKRIKPHFRRRSCGSGSATCTRPAGGTAGRPSRDDGTRGTSSRDSSGCPPRRRRAAHGRDRRAGIRGQAIRARFLLPWDARLWFASESCSRPHGR